MAFGALPTSPDKNTITLPGAARVTRVIRETHDRRGANPITFPLEALV